MLVIKKSPDLDLLDLAATLATSCVSASVGWLLQIHYVLFMR